VHDRVDLAQCLAGDGLDRRQRVARAARIPFCEQSRGAGMDQDHVDGVAGRVVEVARDPRPFLGGRELALALSLALGPVRPLLELRDALAAQPNPVADNPRAAPNHSSERGWDDGELVASDTRGGNVDREQSEYRCGGCSHAGTGCGAKAEKEQRDHWPDGRPRRIVETVDHGARRRSQHEHDERRPAAGNERQRRAGGKENAQQIEIPRLLVAGYSTLGHEHQRQRESGDRDA
jgi:hypothetical protein